LGGSTGSGHEEPVHAQSPSASRSLQERRPPRTREAASSTSSSHGADAGRDGHRIPRSTTRPSPGHPGRPRRAAQPGRSRRRWTPIAELLDPPILIDVMIVLVTPVVGEAGQAQELH
jgi:hypothetical protein